MTAVTVTCAEDASSAEWDAYVDTRTKAEAYHQYRWRHVLESALRCRCYYLQATNGAGSIAGVLPLAHMQSRLFGNFLISLPYLNYAGVLADDADTENALLTAASDLAARLQASHVELRHRDGDKISLPCRDDKVAMLLQLPATEEELWQRFKPKLRSQIRRPTKEGATCLEGGIELLDDFYAVFSRNMRDLGTPVHAKSLFANICETFPDSARIHIVYLAERAVAAGITVRFRHSMEIPSASSLREYNRYSVNMLLYWSVLKSAIRDGCAVFDFGRSSRDSGTYQFKKQWGAEPQQLIWYYCLLNGAEIPKLNPDNARFRLATRIWRWLPMSVANLVGPMLVRNLP